MFSKSNEPLSPAVFYILLSLGVKDRHGYDIMKSVTQVSHGTITLGPGTLYGSIKKMLEEKLIEEVDERPDPSMDDERRRYYHLTSLGKKMLSVELKRFDEALQTAKAAKLDISLTSLKISFV